MNTFLIIFIAFALALDAFAVSFSAGAYYGKASRRQKFRLSFHFGLFQFFMPILGWIAGIKIVKFIQNYDHWIAFAILAIIGSKMIMDSLRAEEEIVKKDLSKGFSLISLSVATSIDALAVGFSLGLINSTIFIPSIIIGIVAASLSLVGIKLGETLSTHFGKKIAMLGGFVLLIIGLNILAQHLNLY